MTHDNSTSPSSRGSISIVVPAYNEESRIRASLEQIEAYLSASGREHEIIAVNDGSVDGTLTILEELQLSGMPLVIVGYERNRGKGYAVRQGMLAASKDLALMTDADLAAPIDQLPKLENALEQGFDIALGSREAEGALLPVRQPVYRQYGGRALNLIIQAFATPGIKDTQCGFKLFRTPAARAIFGVSMIDGFGFDIEAIYLARRLGYGVKEVGITWSHQEGSRVRPFADGFRMVEDIWRIRTARYPSKSSG